MKNGQVNSMFLYSFVVIVVVVVVIASQGMRRVESGPLACIVDCDDIPARLLEFCRTTTETIFPCTAYKIAATRDSLCKRTCLAVNRMPCTKAEKVCEEDPDCPPLCKQFFDQLCPVTEQDDRFSDDPDYCFVSPPPARTDYLHADWDVTNKDWKHALQGPEGVEGMGTMPPDRPVPMGANLEDALEEAGLDND